VQQKEILPYVLKFYAVLITFKGGKRDGNNASLEPHCRGPETVKQSVNGWTWTFVSGGKPPQFTQCHACTALYAELFNL